MEISGNHVIVLIVIIFPTTLAITFTTAVSAGHVYPLVPFMSYTGDLPLESCIFSLGLNICAVLYIIVTVLRYNQIHLYSQRFPLTGREVRKIRAYNHSALVFGIWSTIGLSVTGSFQEIIAPIIHRTGALICSYFGFIYFWHQTLMSHLLIGNLNTARMANYRSCLSVVSTIIHFVAPFIVVHLDTTYPKPHVETLVWTEKEDGWPLHASASTMEWIIFIINELYTASFYWEFKNIKIRSDEVVFL